MGNFNAATAVEALTWDFTAFVPGSKGTIPEPPTELLDAYMREVRDMAKEVQALKGKVEGAQASKDAGDLTDEEVDAILAEMDDISIAKFQMQMAGAIARLTQGQPSEPDIVALPHRVKQAFMQWITGEFRAEAKTPGTN